jgi:molybdopterin converting factor subunit 1
VSISTIRVKVLFFATLKERAGVKEIDLDIQESTPVLQFKELLGTRYPALQEALPSALISINHEYAFDQDLIPEDAEIAIFPPVSGGSQI